MFSSLSRNSTRLPARASQLLLAIAAIVLLAGCGSAARPLPRGHDDLQSIIQADGPLMQAPLATLRKFRALGADRVRVFVSWAQIAPDPSSSKAPAHFDASDPAAYPPGGWTIYDTIVRDAARVGIGLDLTVGAPPPDWAAGPGVPPGANNPGHWRPSAVEFGEFVHALGIRYSGHYTPPGSRSPLPRVNFWAIWNEPNYGVYLAPQENKRTRASVSPTLYRHLLDAAFSALEQTGHTPRTDTILIGETAPRGLPNDPGDFGGMVPLRFIRALYCLTPRFTPFRGRAAVERGCPTTTAGSARFPALNPALFQASGWADHPYPDNAPPNQITPPPVGDGYADFAALGNLESTLDRAAAAYGEHLRLPIYNTEFGYRTDPPGADDTPVALAAAYLNESEYLSWRNPRIRSYSQYLLTDPPPGSNSAFYTGLEFYTGRPKPYVYEAWRMPLWLPVARAGSSRVVWGCVRPAPVIRSRTGHQQRVQIQFAPSGRPYRTVKTITLPARSCYFVTRADLPRPGTVRLAWSGSGPTLFSRPQKLSG
jgi:hypothetical protein